MIISSENLNNLNIVKIQYSNGKKVGQLLGSAASPLYLLDSTLPGISMVTDTMNVWDSGKHVINKIGTTITAISNAAGSADALRSVGGDWAKFSGCVDMRSKFLFSGCAPQKFGMKCMLVNRYGWDVSIAPELEKLANWVLPSRVSDGKGGFVQLTSGLVDELQKANNAVANKAKPLEGLLSFLNEGIEAVGDWMGEIYFLNMPEQFDDLRVNNNVEVVIGKYKFKEVYISGIQIETPRSVMINEKGEPEPDCVIISMQVEGLRQTSTANKPF